MGLITSILWMELAWSCQMMIYSSGEVEEWWFKIKFLPPGGFFLVMIRSFHFYPLWVLAGLLEKN